MGTSSVGVVIVTHRARQTLEACLAPLLASPLEPSILVVNSSSGDGTPELAERLGARVWVLPRRAFDHGRTREAARRRLGTDITVMMTPDAHASHPDFLEHLIRPIVAREAVVSYARQLPRPAAGAIERFDRTFNYPPQSHIRRRLDRGKLGNAVHFCSNACAAWSNAALDAIGGFRATLVSEETIAAALMLERGWSIAYVAEATVVHSHPTGLARDFRRFFDVGYTRRMFADLLLAYERDEVRGSSYASALLAELRRDRPFLVPYALADLAARYLGYRIGLAGHNLPRPLCARLSGQDWFWRRSMRPQAIGIDGLPAAEIADRTAAR